MAVPGNANTLLLKSAAAAGGYTISRSLRFSSGDSSYLSRTPASAGNRKTWTWAGWVKRSTAKTGFIFAAGNTNDPWNSSAVTYFGWGALSGDTGSLDVYSNGTYLRVTSQRFRDYSAWGHLLVACDTTQATAADRLKVYWNGTEITTFSTNNNLAQNTDTYVNGAWAHFIGGQATSVLNAYTDQYLADPFLIDGQALTPSSFGSFDANNIWQPSAFAGSYGTNGFHLPFSDNSNNTATTLGKDTSGAGNNWTPNNLSVTAGAGNDSLTDSPSSPAGQTDSGAGGTVVGNYATLNPLFSGVTLTNGNLDATGPSNAWHIGRGTIAFPVSDKWYWEATVTGTGAASYAISVATAAAANSVGDVTTATGLYGIVNNTGTTTTKFVNGTASTISTVAAWAQNDILMCAYDGVTGKVWFGRNGTWYPPTSGGSAGNPGAGTNETMTASGTVFPTVHCYGSSGNMTVNFGQRPFAYTAPSGFKALCTANLPTPTIANGATAMDVKLYTGNGSSQTISGLGFSPDFCWFKRRSSAFSHELFDVIRGGSNVLFSDLTSAEANNAALVTSFNSDGVSVGSALGANGSGVSSVLWAWDAGTSTVTNTQGSITSSVRANASSGFSIVGYTGTGSAGTLGHGLGVKPQLIIVKSRTQARDWIVYHTSYGATQYTTLNGTGAAAATSSAWNNTEPTSMVFTIGNAAEINTNGSTNIAYCFAPVSGYSSMGSYVGNGSSDGSFVYTGFRPRWVLIKSSSAAGESWFLLDTSRSPYNVSQEYLMPNSSAGETSAYTIMDILSNGFKLKTSGGGSAFNGSGATYIYAAFAESPFAYARAR